MSKKTTHMKPLAKANVQMLMDRGYTREEAEKKVREIMERAAEKVLLS